MWSEVVEHNSSYLACSKAQNLARPRQYQTSAGELEGVIVKLNDNNWEVITTFGNRTNLEMDCGANKFEPLRSTKAKQLCAEPQPPLASNCKGLVDSRTISPRYAVCSNS